MAVSTSGTRMNGTNGIICSSGTNGFDSSVSPNNSSVSAGTFRPMRSAITAGSKPMKSLFTTTGCFSSGPFTNAAFVSAAICDSFSRTAL